MAAIYINAVDYKNNPIPDVTITVILEGGLIKSGTAPLEICIPYDTNIEIILDRPGFKQIKKTILRMVHDGGYTGNYSQYSFSFWSTGPYTGQGDPCAPDKICNEGGLFMVGQEGKVLDLTIKLIAYYYFGFPQTATVEINDGIYYLTPLNPAKVLDYWIILNAVTVFGACLSIKKEGAIILPPPDTVPPDILPPGTETPPQITLPPAPGFPELAPLDTSGFYAFFKSLYENLTAIMRWIGAMISWIGDAIAILAGQFAAMITYFISLQWITDFLDEFFTRLDVWISEKFGIDPALPFWEELVKKAIGWLSGGIDEAAARAIERLK